MSYSCSAWQILIQFTGLCMENIKEYSKNKMHRHKGSRFPSNACRAMAASGSGWHRPGSGIKMNQGNLSSLSTWLEISLTPMCQRQTDWLQCRRALPREGERVGDNMNKTIKTIRKERALVPHGPSPMSTMKHSSWSVIPFLTFSLSMFDVFGQIMTDDILAWVCSISSNARGLRSLKAVWESMLSLELDPFESRE